MSASWLIDSNRNQSCHRRIIGKVDNVVSLKAFSQILLFDRQFAGYARLATDKREASLTEIVYTIPNDMPPTGQSWKRDAWRIVIEQRCNGIAW